MIVSEGHVQVLTRPAEGAESLVELPGVLRRVFAGRGVRDPAELDRSLRHLLAPGTLSDIVRGAGRLARAIEASEPILIVGDFDADGATSVALAYTLLLAMGAENVDFVVPNRFEFGYGLSLEIVELASRMPLLANGGLLVTVDNGVSSTAMPAITPAKKR